jgi:hypothetical protein
MAALIISSGAPKGISPAPRLRPAFPFQEITPVFGSFETLLGIRSADGRKQRHPTSKRAEPSAHTEEAENRPSQESR